MIVHAFEENSFPLPKEKMSQHEEWTEEENVEYIPPKERPEITTEKEKGSNEFFKDDVKYQSPRHT